MKLDINIRQTPKGFIATSPFMDCSIYAGIKAFGKTEDNAANNLLSKWNKKVKGNREAVTKSLMDNVEIVNYSFNLTELKFELKKKEQ